ncbi:MYB-like transcription factor EOBII [Lactuca sativa]|uniref:Uncharacterized protein n=1 Tax=Lactuca sativa TaxID=4236 RepID=A0A9R1X5N4_LACSA|nr:MYB-like transcription factor EOBII [Lactuca sativa]KAJ0198709.1 hypothetical protein LSAT_V11C600342020 [Lactuca sativa]
MEVKSNSCIDMSGGEEDDQMNMIMIDDIRRGPWTVEEDFALINYIAHHGEGRWNSLARCAGLKRTGKSCRLRWLNYLRPDVRRGNITLEEQLLILELHSRWGNRWSKIAQHLPGRTDNEIKNYWRTRVQKHAKQLKCDVNSKQFKDTMRYLWMPRLVERIQAASTNTGDSSSLTTSTTTTTNHDDVDMDNSGTRKLVMPKTFSGTYGNTQINPPDTTEENSRTTAVSPVSGLTDCYYPMNQTQNQDSFQNINKIGDGFDGSLTSPSGYFNQTMDFEAIVEQNNQCSGVIDFSDNLWNVDDFLFFQQHFDRM